MTQNEDHGRATGSEAGATAGLAQSEEFAHELCNLVQVVAGYLEMLTFQIDDEVALRYIGSAQIAADQIGALAAGLDAAAGQRGLMFPR
ncbi:MAG: hypothetical protein B7Z08_01890 [Sphingomonadales bacterium 32-68-7]|nr:MAG: hypothetical protein B7Z33_08085 [Sphingomonadales bacterium 12-68-11]OYX10242.1 MAG: hypothetical protein B7Z08_01890 [Sphingomonadales bacterium 32-68-7]